MIMAVAEIAAPAVVEAALEDLQAAVTVAAARQVMRMTHC
jgi:hypothetical protein